jgi:hypothetical protein
MGGDGVLNRGVWFRLDLEGRGGRSILLVDVVLEVSLEVLIVFLISD